MQYYKYYLIFYLMFFLHLKKISLTHGIARGNVLFYKPKVIDAFVVSDKT